MKILALHSGVNPDQSKRSAVDAWRIKRPIRELRKHTDWQIDERQSLIPSVGKMKSAKEFTPRELEKAFIDVCQYDIIFSAYQSNPSLWTLLQVARERAGTQYIMDVDDNMFAINPDNPVWTNITDDNVYSMQRMIANNPWITTTTQRLAKVFIDRRPDMPADSVNIIPNYVSDDYKEYDPANGERIVIGFFGGSTHYGDLHRTGVLEAVQKIMHEHKNVYFKSVGMVVDTYLPRARVIIGDAQRGDPWTNEIFPSLNMDIALGPLEDNIFNLGKSNIKWQESTRAGAAFVCSNIGPYADLSPHVALKCQNSTDSWYNALLVLVEDAEKRRDYVRHARSELFTHHRLETHWQDYKKLFEVAAEARLGKIATATVIS
jgi:hypothetical protein